MKTSGPWRHLKDEELRHLMLEQKLRAIEEYEKLLVKEGLVPDASRLFMRRYRWFFSLLGGLMLALFVSVVAILANFMICNKFFHLWT